MKVALAAAVVAVLVAGCGRGAADPTVALPDGGHSTASQLSRAASGLCDATRQSRHDAAMAASTFYLRSHTDLHTLASAVGLVDRARSARLLEAMYTVEQDIDARPARPALTADLAALAHLAGGDLQALHVPAPACTTRTDP